MSENECNITNKVDMNHMKTTFMEKVVSLKKTARSFHIEIRQKYEELISEIESAKMAKKGHRYNIGV